MKINPKRVKIFKIKNRRGYAATCMNNLTEGRTIVQAYDRMIKAQRRNGNILEPLKTNRLKKLIIK